MTERCTLDGFVITPIEPQGSLYAGTDYGRLFINEARTGVMAWWSMGRWTDRAAREAIIAESREMLGIMEQLRYNGLAHLPATRTRRSSRMRVKLQLVLCSDEGQEETVTEVITLNKNSQRIEHLGLTLAESKQLLSTLQRW